MASADSSMTPEEKYQLISRNLQVGFKLKVIPGLIFSKQDRHMVINIPWIAEKFRIWKKINVFASLDLSEIDVF